MTKFLFAIVSYIAKIHNMVLSLNDTYEYQFTDKELHFIVIGAIGMIILFCVYPVFNYLAKKNHILSISSIYAFTLIVVITFAIEIGQKITKTGNMEFADILFGVSGFIFMYLLLVAILGFAKLVISIFKKLTHSNDDGTDENNK